MLLSATRYHLLGWLSLALLVPAPALAQAPHHENWSQPNWTSDLGLLGANALLGGLTAGIEQRLRGGSFIDGLVKGSLGGTVVYAGKRIAAERFDGAGLLGRQTAAVGGSIVRNAAESHALLEQLWFPLGPINLYVQTREAPRVRAKLSAYSLAWLIRAATTDELEFRASQSLSAGATVFHAPGRRLIVDGDELGGQEVAGIVLVSGATRSDPEHVFAHERVHVLQYDFQRVAWAAPVETWLASKIGLVGVVHRWVDFDIVPSLLWLGLGSAVEVDYEKRPWEIEAEFLSR